MGDRSIIFRSSVPINRVCITVDIDTSSLRGYSVSGFGPNYCGENEAQLGDKLENVCLWGGTGASIAISALSGGVTGTVIIPVVIGGASVACEKLNTITDRWPHTQY